MAGATRRRLSPPIVRRRLHIAIGDYQDTHEYGIKSDIVYYEIDEYI